MKAFDEHLPPERAPELIPFTSNGGHAIVALDYSHGEVPGVSLVPLDDEPDLVVPIAPSFEAFLDLLHD